MSVDLGEVPAGVTIYVPWTTHAQTGAKIDPLSGYETSDVFLYKNGSVTQRSSASGWTITSDFDSSTGLHVLAIDLSDNTDAGFYSVGAYYFLTLDADTETVDGLSVIAVLATFRIKAAEAITGKAKVDIDGILGTAISTPATAGILDVNLKNIANAAVSTSSAQLGVNAVQAGATAWNSGAIKTTSFTAGAIDAAAIAADAIGASELAADAVTEIQSGLSVLTQANVRTAVGLASANLDTQLAAIQADTDDIQTRIPAALAADGSIKASVQSFLGSAFTEGAGGRIAAAFKQFFNIATPAATMDHGILVDTATTATTASALTTNNDKTGYTLSNTGIDALYTRALSESYAAKGAAPTVAQALLAIQQFLAERVDVSTTLTVAKLDGSTTAMTFTLNDATAPTSITRAT